MNVKIKNEKFIVPVFYDGENSLSLLMKKAVEILSPSKDIDSVSEIFGLEACKLLVRIRRYADGRHLREPEEFTDEHPPFFAIKSTSPPVGETWEEFKARKGKESELIGLRAYFWSENGIETNRSLMCITHFAQKKSRYMTNQDKSICNDQKYLFEINGYSYEKC